MQVDGVGPARYLSTNPDELVSQLGSGDSPIARSFAGEPADALRHSADRGRRSRLRRERFGVGGGPGRGHRGARSHTEPHREQYPDPEKPILRIAGGAIERWADRRLATLRRQRRRDSARRRRASGPAAVALGLQPDPHRAALGGDPRRQLHHAAGYLRTRRGWMCPTLWAPRRRDDELRVPIGVTATGEPLVFDLKDEAEGGMGPHGLMIGMTGSGKSQTLMSILLSLLTTHSGGPADRHLRRLQG